MTRHPTQKPYPLAVQLVSKLTGPIPFDTVARRFGTFHPESRLVSTTDFSSLARIGIDESGKGDYFGPLVVAAVFVEAAGEADLRLMQVRDSKKISDGRILEMAVEIKQVCRHSIVAIGPQRYNELYAKMRNLNRLLAWGHARALENLLEQVDCSLAISDQFGDQQLVVNALQERGKLIRLVQHPKAEADLAVAAASILARSEFLRRLQRLSDEVGTTLPKGASPAVELAARMVLKKHGRDRLGAVARRDHAVRLGLDRGPAHALAELARELAPVCFVERAPGRVPLGVQLDHDGNLGLPDEGGDPRAAGAYSRGAARICRHRRPSAGEEVPARHPRQGEVAGLLGLNT